MRLALRIPLLSVGAVLITGLATAVVAIVVGQSAVRSAAFDATVAGADAYVRTVQVYLQHANQDLDSLAELDPVRQAWDQDGLAPVTSASATRDALSRATSADATFEYVALIHPDGAVYLVAPVESQAQLSRPDVGFYPWFRTLTANGRVVSDLHVSTVTHRSSVVIATGVHDADGNLLGYVVGALRLADVSALGGSPSGAYFGYLTDGRGLVVAHGRDPRLAEFQTDFSSVPPVAAALGGSAGVMEEYNQIEGEDRVAAYRPLPGSSWTVEYVVPTRVAFASASQVVTSTAVATLVLVLIVGLFAAGVARRATAPIGRLSVAATAIAAGDMTTTLPPAGRDEVGLLSGEFKRMIEMLREREDELRHGATELRRLNAELEAFAYSIAHDLRAPLRAIDGFGGMLAKRLGDGDAESTRQLGIVRSNARRMAELIDDLLDFARIGRLTPELKELDPGVLAREAYQELGPDVSQRRIDFSVRDMPRCRADPRLLERVFANLISNAVKFTAGRFPAVIEVGCRTDQSPVAYYVRDNGIGLDMAYAEVVFGVFKRLVTEEEYEGTGVGLAIVRRIVEQHRGRVWVEAAPDRGATFLFTLEEGHT